MSEWFQAKVKFLRQQDNGLVKESTELYLIDAVSFTDAETRAFKEAGDNRDVQAVSIARSPIKEVMFYGDTDQWHKAKVCYSLMDEDTEKEKKVTTYFLVNAATVKEAYDRTEEHLKEMLVPFTIPKVEESPICEVFQYEKQAPKGFVKVEKTASESEDYWKASRKSEKELGDEHEEDCAMEGDIVKIVVGNALALDVPNPLVKISEDGSTIEFTYPTAEYTTGLDLRVKSIDPTDGQSVALSPMTLEAYLEDIRPNYTADVLESIRSAYKRFSNTLFMMQLSLMAFTEPQREMIADICENEAAMKGGCNGSIN